jgi:hypothetical protein
MICLRTNLHMPSYNGSLIIAIKPETKGRHVILHSIKNYLNKSCVFFLDLLPCVFVRF